MNEKQMEISPWHDRQRSLYRYLTVPYSVGFFVRAPQPNVPVAVELLRAVFTIGEANAMDIPALASNPFLLALDVDVQVDVELPTLVTEQTCPMLIGVSLLHHA